MTTLAWEIYELPQLKRGASLFDALLHPALPAERKYPHKTRKVKAKRARKQKKVKR